MDTDQRTTQVKIVIFPGCNIIDATGPTAVFGAANEIKEPAGAPTKLYDVRFIAPDVGPVETTAGPALYASETLRNSSEGTDILICAGGKGVHAFAQVAENTSLVALYAQNAKRVVSVCTGAFILAAAGVLNGRNVATHWDHCAELSAQYPDINVDPAPIFVRDGRYMTSAGVTAGMDLALAIVEEDFGRELALNTAREMVMYMKRPGNQTQFSAHLAAQMATDDRLRRLQLWILENLRNPLSIERMADKVAMTPRTLHRRFKKATGMSPAKFISTSRVENACRLLEESTVPVKAIADQCGFGDEERMRRTFHRVLGIAPDAYRERFTTTEPTRKDKRV